MKFTLVKPSNYHFVLSKPFAILHSGIEKSIGLFVLSKKPSEKLPSSLFSKTEHNGRVLRKQDGVMYYAVSKSDFLEHCPDVKDVPGMCRYILIRKAFDTRTKTSWRRLLNKLRKQL